jgi:nucleotide-binding universal stress UspA family protein
MTAPAHVLAVYERSRRGDDAVRRAAELAARSDARLTVVTVAVSEPTDRKCCDTRSVYWNEVLREIAADELDCARLAVGSRAAVEFRVISGRSVPSAIADEAELCDADVIVLGHEQGRLPWTRMRRARQVQRRTSRVVIAA